MRHLCNSFGFVQQYVFPKSITIYEIKRFVRFLIKFSMATRLVGYSTFWEVHFSTSIRKCILSTAFHEKVSCARHPDTMQVWNRCVLLFLTKCCWVSGHTTMSSCWSRPCVLWCSLKPQRFSFCKVKIHHQIPHSSSNFRLKMLLQKDSWFRSQMIMTWARSTIGLWTMDNKANMINMINMCTWQLCFTAHRLFVWSYVISPQSLTLDDLADCGPRYPSAMCSCPLTTSQLGFEKKQSVETLKPHSQACSISHWDFPITNYQITFAIMFDPLKYSEAQALEVEMCMA